LFKPGFFPAQKDPRAVEGGSPFMAQPIAKPPPRGPFLYTNFAANICSARPFLNNRLFQDRVDNGANWKFRAARSVPMGTGF
jgi:hypothetical protein